MSLVIADTSPIVYLLAIGHVDILPALFAKVYLPDAVRTELRHPLAPVPVGERAEVTPPWVEVRSVGANTDADFQGLGEGERAAMALALSLRADLLLIDERKAPAPHSREG